ncbi:MAG: PEGA domain-containing protein [Nitrospira sp. CG24A]|nr:MAG: PEGA domain-containing protein [Nitrospira sp. CG24A]
MQWLQIVKKVSFQLISLAVVSCYLTGCSLFGPRSESIGVSSDPPGARVIASGKPVGTTPLYFEAQRGDNLLIEVQKSGYQTQYRTLSRRISTLGILDIVGGAIWLVPFFGLLSSAAYEHDPAEIGITLEPEQKMAPTQ